MPQLQDLCFLSFPGCADIVQSFQCEIVAFSNAEFVTEAGERHPQCIMAIDDGSQSALDGFRIDFTGDTQ